ncbi:hypothetical protein HAU46_08555 [Weissella confusa]|uniref:hypothetical protein n=1 Tax=Weissella confusa TaxID=1583 RepID=UPI0002465E0D|nr:hypothetical protein [Weissella confusa]MBJ7648021.1 hypothetical protein [Weissella confusa]MBJ7671925.1 hypothetical protein [Weissella confusa]CCF31043.1 Protein of unknown function [Weissella confusa LBAE C39-2]
MVIAGIEPVGYTNDKMMGPGEESNTNIVTGELLSVDLPTGIPLFTDEQVREILERYDQWIQYVGNDDVDGFMESGE